MIYIILPILFAGIILVNIILALIKGALQNIVAADAIIAAAVVYFLAHDNGIHTVFSILLGLVAGACFVALTKIPVFGKIFVVLCGFGWAYAVYETIDQTGEATMTNLLANDPIWWWAIVIMMVLVFVGLHLKCVIKSIPSNDIGSYDVNEYTGEALTEVQPVSVSSPADDTIKKLSKEINLMCELNIHSQEQLFAAIDKLENSIAERQVQIKNLMDELTLLNEKNLRGQQSDEEAKRGNLILLQIERLRAGIDTDKEKISQLTEISNKHVNS